MLSTIACLALLPVASSPAAGDFFPTTPGSKWVYQDTVKQSGRPEQKQIYTDTAGSQEEFIGLNAIPITTRDSLGGSYKAHYMINEDSVDILLSVKVDGEPIPIMYPILKVGEKEAEWNYTGVTDFGGDPAEMALDAKSRLSGTKEVLGNKVETLEVKMTVVLNVVPRGVVNSLEGAAIVTEQTAVYGKGVGLIELKEKVTIAKSTMERNRKILSYTISP